MRRLSDFLIVVGFQSRASVENIYDSGEAQNLLEIKCSHNDGSIDQATAKNHKFDNRCVAGSWFTRKTLSHARPEILLQERQ